MNDQRKNKYFDKTIVEAVRENLSFYAWQSIGGIIEKCELKIKAYRKDYKEIELKCCPGQETQLEKIISGNRFVNIYVPERSVSFSSELKSVSVDKIVKLYTPIEYTFFERRKHVRIQTDKTCYVRFEDKKVMVKKTIYDFSIGGVSIVLPKTDKVSIEKGKMFTDFVLEIGNRKMKIKAECVSSFSIDRFEFENLPYGGFKLAFRFIDLGKEDKTFITEFLVNEILMKQVVKQAN